MELQAFDLDVIYRKGADNHVADALSRQLPNLDTPVDLSKEPGVHSLKGGGGVGSQKARKTY